MPELQPTAVLNIVGLTPSLIGAHTPRLKAFFDRTKDWADLEEMAAVGTLDVDRVAGVLARYLGPTDERIERLRTLA